VHVCYNTDKSHAVLHTIMNILSLLLKELKENYLAPNLAALLLVHISTELTHLFEDSLNVLITAVVVQ